MERWQNHRRALLRSTSVDLYEQPEEQEQRIARLKGDFEAFCRHYFPHYFTAPFAKFHQRQSREVITNERAVFAYIMAREHAKSVLHGVFLPIYLMVNRELRNMVLASWSEDNAIDLLMPLQMELESNQRLIHDYGKMRRMSRWEDGNFVTHQGCSFRALGSGQSPRGMRNQEARPDYVLADDFDNDVVCRNPVRLQQAHDWLMGALFPAMSMVGRRRFIMIGNIIAPDTVIGKVREKADFTMQVDLLDKKGRPSWPERYSLAVCREMIEKLGERLAQREYFNNPIQEGSVFKKAWISDAQLPSLKSYPRLVAYLDPGFKKTKTSDSKAWILVGLREGKYDIIRAFVDVASIGEMIGWGYAIKEQCDQAGAAVQLYMEEVFLQDLLYDDFAREGKLRGVPLPVRGDKRNKPNKDARIEAMSGLFERGFVRFNKAEADNHHMKRLKEQLLNFGPGANTKKDGPDALEGAIHILNASAVTPADIVIAKRPKHKNRLS